MKPKNVTARLLTPSEYYYFIASYCSQSLAVKNKIPGAEVGIRISTLYLQFYSTNKIKISLKFLPQPTTMNIPIRLHSTGFQTKLYVYKTFSFIKINLHKY